MHPTTPLPPCNIFDLRNEIVTHITARRRRFHVNCVDIDDLAQSALTKILASMNTYRPDRGDFRAWAFGIVHNVLCHYTRDLHRHNARFSGHYHNVDEYEAPEPSPEQCVQRQQARRAILNVVDDLEPKKWAVVTLHAIDDLSHADIGQEIGMTEAASQKCFQRTRNKLAQCLDNEIMMVMPFVTVGCNDKRSNERDSRWSWVYYGLHYTGQITSLIAVGLLALSLNPAVSTIELAPIPVAMPQDKPTPVMPSETVKQQDKPADKRESAPAPRVRVVRAPKITVDKPTSTTLPSYTPPGSPISYRQLGR